MAGEKYRRNIIKERAAQGRSAWLIGKKWHSIYKGVEDGAKENQEK